MTSGVLGVAEAKAFTALFQGLDRAYGGESGLCIKEPLSEQVFVQHLLGKRSIGVYPLSHNGTVRWVCTDYDAKDQAEPERWAVAQRLRDAFRSIGANPYLERSRGKGYHCWLFFREPVPARLALALARHAVHLAGLPPTTEIFPKQDTLDGIDFGNYVNLPYAGFADAVNTGKRVIVDEDGNAVPLDDFLAGVRFTDLNDCAFPDPGETPAGSGNILEASEAASDLLLQDVTEGERHTTLLRIIGLLAQLHDASVVTELARSFNATHCRPPLADAEITRMVKYCLGKQDTNGGKAASGKTAATSGDWRAIFTRMLDVDRKVVDWRWRHSLPIGKLVVVSGDPGEGKSWLTMAFAAHISRGLPLPGDVGEFDPMRILLLNGEDGAGDTIVGRLEDLGADLGAIEMFTHLENANGRKRWIDLFKDLGFIEMKLAEGDFGMLIIDPINAFLGDLDAHKDTAIRRVLGPVSAMAERYGVAVLVLRHLNKGSGGKALYRGLGSIGYTGAARVEWLVGHDPDRKDEHEHVISIAKNNLAAKDKSVTYTIKPDADGNGRFEWGDEVDLTADQMVADGGGKDRVTKRQLAIEFLSEALAHGERDSNQLLKEAEDLGIGRSTLFAAKKEIGAGARHHGIPGQQGGGTYYWYLPEFDI